MTILDMTSQLIYDKSREAELMDILGIQSMDEVTIIPWRPPTTPPAEASYVFVKYREPHFEDISFDFFAYEKGVYTYYNPDGSSFELTNSHVLGWAYPINYRK